MCFLNGTFPKTSSLNQSQVCATNVRFLKTTKDSQLKSNRKEANSDILSKGKFDKYTKNDKNRNDEKMM